MIDLHISAREGLTVEGLSNSIAPMDFDYYVKGPISEGTFRFMLPADGQRPETTAAAAQIGLRFHSSDEKYVAQCRLSEFTLSRLPPYEDWATLLMETSRIWSLYVERLTPQRVTRVATRFINNLRLPLETGASFQTYLQKLVDVPEEAPQAVEVFFQRFQLVDAPSGARVILTVAFEGMAADGTAPVILDVDAFMSTNLDPTDPELWNILERLRELKNRSFFGTITERAAGLYK
ncbi:MAG: TIGR04255 family protein [Gammaproteobacteria bacterium]|nr:TIGR04255 family protein [Gammaproteobacteria bacterium]